MKKIKQRFLDSEQQFDMGSLHSTKPVSPVWGFDRGTPVDRYYIERFLEPHKNDISGHVVEVMNNEFTLKYGHNIQKRDVLDINANNPNVTILTDLAAADNVESDIFDCFVFTQTLHLIYDMKAALYHARRILRPGGILLATVPTINRISPKSEIEHDYWRLTPSSCQRMFGETFGQNNISVSSYGNVLTSITNLAGIVKEELNEEELNAHDESYPVMIGIRAVK